MPITREEKKQLLKTLEEEVSASQAVLLTNYRGLRVEEMRGLRQRLREVNCSYRVVKNRLLGLALAKIGVEIPPDLLAGPTAVGICHGDVVAPAKALVDFAEEGKVLSIRGGILGRRILGQQEVVDLAKLPPREELLRRLLGQVQSPLYRLRGTLAAPLQQLLAALHARSQQLQTEEEVG